MSEHLGWGEIALRLALTVLAGGVIGLNRYERRRAAGFRTTILVCLAASITMILVNLLLPPGGSPEGLTRLPQGLLAGMGFIGAGAIVRRGKLVEGVTTAATLWYVTIMGLCLGAGYVELGLAALGLAAIVLWCLKWLERRIGIARHARLMIGFQTGSSAERQAVAALADAGYKVAARSRTIDPASDYREVRYDLSWFDHGRVPVVPDLIDDLARQSGVHRVEWRDAAIER